MFNLNLLEQEVITILHALNKLPREISDDLFRKIDGTASAQKQAMTQAPAAATPAVEAPAETPPAA